MERKVIGQFSSWKTIPFYPFAQKINITGKVFPHLENKMEMLFSRFSKGKKDTSKAISIIPTTYLNKTMAGWQQCSLQNLSSLPSSVAATSAIQLKVSFGIYGKLFKCDIFLCIGPSMKKLVLSILLCVKCQ